ncbi:MAG TPA: outer membrane beta-barrel protein [Gemmatimonadales bacterium]|nr:outer membrane beta-barrel protein [Gemmatimonadales bacterium]
MAALLRRLAPIALAVAAVTGSPGMLGAQGWRVGSFGGYYQPTGDLVSGSVTFPALPDVTGSFTGKSTGGFGFGATIGYELPSGLGFELGGAYYRSDVEFDVCATDGVDTECAGGDEYGTVVPLVGRITYRFSPLTARTQFYGAAGAAWLLRGGDAWEGDEIETNVFGGSLAIGILHSVADMLKLRVELGDFLYSSKPFDAADLEALFQDEFGEEANATVDSKFKNDFTLTVGFLLHQGK